MSDWVCGRCKSINRERAASCYSCGGIRGAMRLEPNATFGGGAATTSPGPELGAGAGVGSGTAALSGAAVGGGEAGGIAFAEVTMPEPTPVLPAGPMQYLGGALGGAVGAVIATAVWYGVVAMTNWQIGLVAVAVGFIVGQGVLLGASGRGSVLLVPISLAFTLVALVASEYLIANHFLTEAALEMGVDVEFARAMFTPVELVRTSLESDPLTLLFWAIAGYEAVVIPMRSVRR